MKKFLLVGLLFFVSIKVVNASDIEVKNSDYYITCAGTLVNLKKSLYEGKEVFSTGYFVNEEDGEIIENVNKDILEFDEAKYKRMINAIYFGYEVNKKATDAYYYTQALIYKYRYGAAQVKMCDKYGIELTEENDKLNNLLSYVAKMATDFVAIPQINDKVYNLNVWEPLNIEHQNYDYSTDEKVLITKIEDKVNFIGNIPGVYKVTLSNNYHDKILKTLTNIYIINTSLPSRDSYNFTIKIEGIKLNLKVLKDEFMGDASLDNVWYEIYENDVLKDVLTLNQNNIYLNKNREYTLKLIRDEGFDNKKEIKFRTQNNDYDLEIEAKVIKSLVRFGDVEGNIYLKSTNELVGEVKKEIMLPFGEYYIVTNDNKKILFEVQNKADLFIKSEREKDLLVAPQTFDSIDYIVIFFILSLVSLGVLVKISGKIDKK